MELREKERFEKVINDIQKWAKERGIDKKGTIEGQRQKTLEEIEELRQAINDNNYDEIIDAIGDIFVTLVVGRMLYEPKDVTVDIVSLVNQAKKESEFKNGTIQMLRVNKSDLIDESTINSMHVAVFLYFLKVFNLNPYISTETIYVLVNLYYFCDIYKLELIDCIESAYNEIKDRKGKMIDGTFVKEV